MILSDILCTASIVHAFRHCTKTKDRTERRLKKTIGTKRWTSPRNDGHAEELSRNSRRCGPVGPAGSCERISSPRWCAVVTGTHSSCSVAKKTADPSHPPARKVTNSIARTREETKTARCVPQAAQSTRMERAQEQTRCLTWTRDERYGGWLQNPNTVARW